MLRRGVQLSSLLFLVGPHAPRGVDHLWGIGFDACEVGLASREIRLHWKSPPPAEQQAAGNTKTRSWLGCPV